jgi:gliding motility-associated lipoprotein GldH
MRNKAKIFILAIAGLLMAACNRGVIYYHYEHVDEEGWERTDTIHFYIPAVKEAGSYRQKLLLRTDNSVPFQNLNVTIEQDIYPRDMKLSKSINCILIDKNGGVNGKGISCFQYAFDMDNVDLYEGDSLHICVTHNMKRETMPGVNDIGILISK